MVTPLFCLHVVVRQEATAIQLGKFERQVRPQSLIPPEKKNPPLSRQSPLPGEGNLPKDSMKVKKSWFQTLKFFSFFLFFQEHYPNAAGVHVEGDRGGTGGGSAPVGGVAPLTLGSILPSVLALCPWAI